MTVAALSVGEVTADRALRLRLAEWAEQVRTDVNAATVTLAGPWTTKQTTTVTSGSVEELISTSAGGGGVVQETYANSASPAAFDVLRDLDIYSNNSTPAKTLMGRLRLWVQSVTATSETSNWEMWTRSAGTLAIRWIIGTGIWDNIATGGNKGAGTINVSGDLYKNNSAFTNPDYVFEHAFTGRIERFKDRPGASQYRGPVPLSELEQFLRDQWSLANRPTSAIGAFQRADWLLEKLEEQALYICQLHKRVAALERRR